MMFIHLKTVTISGEHPDTCEPIKVELPERYINPDAIQYVTILRWTVRITLHDQSIDLPRNSEQAASLLRYLERNGGNF